MTYTKQELKDKLQAVTVALSLSKTPEAKEFWLEVKASIKSKLSQY